MIPKFGILIKHIFSDDFICHLTISLNVIPKMCRNNNKKLSIGTTDLFFFHNHLKQILIVLLPLFIHL